MFREIQRKFWNHKGFTLIELIVVIAIIAILAAVLIPRFAGFTDGAKEKAAMADAKNIVTAVAAYYAGDPSAVGDVTGDIGDYTDINGTVNWTGDTSTTEISFELEHENGFTATVVDSVVTGAAKT